MKRLTLVRHAKSDWNTGMPDFDRPLNARGEQAAPFMAARLAQFYPKPDRLVSSPAVRALRTATLIAHGIDIDASTIITLDTLYNASVKQLLAAIQATDDAIEHLMVVAHNPGLTDLANQLTDSQIDNLSTCAVLGADLEIEHWRDVRAHCGRARYYDFPKNPSPPVQR